MPLINTPEPEATDVQPLIGLPTEPPLPREVAAKRAQKYHMALGDDSPGPEQITERLITGQDQALRDIMATRKLLKQREAKSDMLDEIAQREGPVSLQTLDYVYNLDLEKAAINPDTAIEEAYARTSLQGSLLGGFNFTLGEDEDALHTALDAGEEAIVRKEGFLKLNEDYRNKLESQSWAKYGAEFVGSSVPFFTAANFEKVAKEVIGDAGWTVGGNIDMMRDFILAQSPDVGIKLAKEIAGRLEQDNLGSAVQFTEALLQYSSSQQAFDSAFTAITDVASLAPIKAAKAVAGVAKNVKKERDAAKVIKDVITERAADSRFDVLTQREVVEALDTVSDARQATSGERVTKAVKDVVKSLLRRQSNPEDALAAAGHVEESAVVATIRNLKQSIRSGLKPLNGEIGTLVENIPSIYNPGIWLGASSKAFTRDSIQKIERELAETGPELIKTLFTGIRIERLPESDKILEAMVNQAKEVSKLKYREVADRIFDARPAVTPTPAGDVWQVGVRWRDHKGELFETPLQAEKAAEELGFLKFRVGQQGGKYYLETFQAVDETAPEIRSLLLTTENQTPRTYAGMFVNWLKSPEDLVSQATMADRKAATHGISRLEGSIKVAAERIGKLGKQSRENLRTFLDNDRRWSEEITNPDGSTQLVEGRFATDLRDFETRWHSNFGTYPTEAETTAYLEFVRISDLDWAFRNFRVLRDKSRLGVELHDIKLTNPDGSELIFSGVEAKVVEEIPFDKEAGILVLKDGQGPQFFRSNQTGVRFTPEINSLDQKAYVEYLQKEGYTLLHVSEFGEHTLKANPLIRHPEGMGAVQDEKIHYLLVRGSQSRPLPVQQLPYRPGAHRLYQDGFYISQPKITRLQREAGEVLRYDYDKNIMMFGNEAQAKKFAQRYETVRQMLLRGEPDEAIDAYVRANLSKSPDEIRSLFRPKFDDEGKQVAEPMLSLTEPIGTRFTGTKLGDSLNLKAQYPTLRNSWEDDLSLYKDMNKDFIGGRDPVLETIEEAGTEANPIYKTADARMIDVFSTLNHGVRQMFKARYLDDIKTKEMEKFVQEFGHTIKATPEELAINPTKYIYDTPWNENASRLDVAAAKNSLMSLKQFLGTQTKFSRDLEWVKQKLANAAYNKFGDRHIPVVSNLLLSTTKDPLQYARGVAFHTKLGLFNPVQLFLQGQTYFHMAAIVGPKLAVKAGPAAVFARMLHFTDNEKIIDDFAAKVGKFGMNKEDFKEAYLAMREAGIDRVGGEVAMRDTLYDPQLIQSKTGQFLEWGTTFFNEGERFVRTSAYMAAFMEWRGAVGVAKKLTNADKLKILNRADLLSGNMTRASNASWQRGLASIPTQFFTYQFRIMEQLLGKRLGATTQERMLTRARILGTYSALYGLPVAAGATTAVWPWTETVREELIKRNIDYDENVLTQGLVEGFAGVLLEKGLGLRTNVGQRYGPGGLNVLQDFFSSDTFGAELFFGVSGSSLKSMFQAALPGMTHLRDIMMGEAPDVQLALQDMIDFTREISSVNNMLKTIHGMNYGKYITKREIEMTDVTPPEALVMGLAGLQPLEVDDAFLKGKILKAEGEYKTTARTDARKWFSRALREEDPDLQMKYLKRGSLIIEGAGLDWRERAQVFRDVVTNNQTFVQAMDKKFAGSSDERMKEYIEKHQESK